MGVVMARHHDRRAIVRELLRRHGRTYCDELGIDLAGNTPSALFRWVCATILFSTRISAGIALAAGRALAEEGWTTPQKIAAASWERRTGVLNHAGYARYDESTSTKLADAAELLMAEYGGDLRRLRARARGDPEAVRELIQELKGIGPTGADIFCREAQIAWEELFPFADKKALATARRLGLGGKAEDLAGLVERGGFPRLVAALVRADLADDVSAVRKAAA
jgi:hypothetical protein